MTADARRPGATVEAAPAGMPVDAAQRHDGRRGPGGMTLDAAAVGADWPVEVVEPFPGVRGVVFGRCAARSSRFGGSAAAGGEPVIVGSAAGPDAASVVPRARGELAERVGNVLAGRRAEAAAAITGSYEELRRRLPVLDPAELNGDGATRTAPLLWVPGASLRTGAAALVPAGAAHLHHRPPPGCVAAVRSGSTGLAAHGTQDAAVRHAALEVLERHLLVAAWYAEPPPVLAAPEPPAALTGVLADLGLRARLWALAGPGALVCVVACVHGPDGSGQAFGARCAPELPTAVEVAVFEALMVRWSMTTPAADHARAALRHGQRQRGDWGPRTIVEHAVHAFDGGHALAHLEQRLGESTTGADRRTSAGTGAVDPLDHPSGAGDPDLRDRPTADGADVVDLLARTTGSDVIAVDTAGPAGSALVRLIVPGARRLPRGAVPGAPPHPFG